MNKRKQLVFDLQCAIGDSYEGAADWFTAQLFKLMLKADCCNRQRLGFGFPEEYRAFELWRRHGGDFLKNPRKYNWLGITFYEND